MATNKHGYPETIVRQTNDFICVAYLRIPDLDKYNGEYGFDWLEINHETGEVIEVQGTPYSKVTHCFVPLNKEGGDVYKRVEDNKFGELSEAERLKDPKSEPKIIKNTDVQNKIKNEYHTIKIVEGMYVDVARILIKKESDDVAIQVSKKKEPEVELDLHIKCLKGVFDGSEIAEIESNEHYKFKLKEHGEFQGTLLIPLEKGKKEAVFKLIIRCDDYTLAKEGEPFEIYLRRDDYARTCIGGFIMMQNKLLELTFRVIALVSKDGNEEAKARQLFDDFKNNEVKEFLNNNSLNQAGYHICIENEDAINNPNAKLDEYLYAFDKKIWEDKKYFHEKQPYDVRYYKQNENGDYVIENGKYVLVKEERYADVLDAQYLDNITICAYRKKLQDTRNSYKDYLGGLIILSEYRSKENRTSAFSKVKPLNHHHLFVYATNENDVHTFAHEIGHMLGLPHSFADNEVLSFLGLFYSEKLLYKLNLNASTYDKGIKTICCPKENLRKSLENYNKYHQKKKEFTKKINDNKMAISLIDELMPGDYYEFEPGTSFYMLRDDYTDLYEKYYFKYFEDVIKQRKKHILYFEQGASQNKMDYTRSGGKFYTSYQIEIMRDDYGNY